MKICARLIGRSGAVRAAKRALAEALEGCGCALLIAGESGVGKTRLVRQILADAGAAGAWVTRGHCSDDSTAPAYAPWIRVHDDLLRAADPVHARAAAVGAAAMDDPSPWTWPKARAARSAALATGGQKARCHDRFTRELRLLARKAPIVLALEDLQWADSDTLDLLTHVSRYLEDSRVLLIGTYRPSGTASPPCGRLSEALSVLGRNTELRHVSLRGFSLDELAEYLAGEAGILLHPGLVEAIRDETDGNPFYARALLQHLVEVEAVCEREGRWCAARAIREVGVPVSVLHFVCYRLSRLATATAQALRVAAAREGSVDAALVAAVLREPDERAAAMLDEACWTGLLRRHGGHYEFCCAVVHRATYDIIAPGERARIHRRIAEELARIEGAADAEISAHYHRSRELPGADAGVPHALAAAAAAGESTIRACEIELLNVARELTRADDPATRSRVATRLAVAMARDRSVDDALRALEDATRLMLACQAPASAIAEALAAVAEALREGGAEREAWAPLLERGLDVLGGERSLTWARLTLLLDRVEPLAAGAIYAWRWIPPPQEATSAARASGQEGDYALTISRHAARTCAETHAALRLALSFRERRAAARVLGAIALDFIYRHCDLTRARACLDRLLAIHEDCSSLPGQLEALAQRAICRAAAGDSEGAQRDDERAQALAARFEPTYALRVTSAVAVPAMLKYLRGEESGWAELAAEASRLVTLPVAAREQHGITVAAMATFASAMAEDRSTAERYLDALTPLLEATERTLPFRGVAVDLCALAVWRLRRTTLAERYLALSEEGVGDERSGAPITCKELNAARMALLLQRTTLARAHLGRAREVLVARSQLAVSAVLDRELTAEPEEEVPPDSLTRREVELLQRLAAGAANKEIAADLSISVATVERHIANIYTKIGVRSRAGATRYAVLHRIVHDDRAEALPAAPRPAGARYDGTTRAKGHRALG